MKPEKILRGIEDEASQKGWPIIGPLKGSILTDAVRQFHPKDILEIGTFVGYSAILMALFLPKGGKITTIEFDPQLVKIAKNNFKKAGFDGIIKAKIGDAAEEIPKLLGPFDLVLLDAAEKEYLDYLMLVESKLKEEAVIIADSIKACSEHVKDYLCYVRKNYKSESFDFGFDAVEVSYKQSKLWGLGSF